MSHFAHVIRNLSCLFCNHEWARRRDKRRVYLECVHCLATTQGVEYGPQSPTAASATRSLRTVEA